MVNNTCSTCTLAMAKFNIQPKYIIFMLSAIPQIPEYRQIQNKAINPESGPAGKISLNKLLSGLGPHNNINCLS